MKNSARHYRHGICRIGRKFVPRFKLLPSLAFFSAVALSLMSTGFAVAEESGKTNAVNGTGTPFELSFWQAVADSNDKAQFEAYLQQYPGGTFSALARLKIAALDKRAAPNAIIATNSSLAPPIAGPVPGVVAPIAMAITASPPIAVVETLPSPPASDSLTLSQQLRALGQSQGVRSNAAVDSRALIPARPVLNSLSELAIPGNFCSATERNSFYDSTYSPAIARADANNQTAIAHMAKLRQAFDQAKAGGDFITANLFVAEANEYDAIAKAAYAARSSYDAAFSQFMAVPISKCAPEGGN